MSMRVLPRPEACLDMGIYRGQAEAFALHTGKAGRQDPNWEELRTGFSQWNCRAKSAQKPAGSWMERLYSAS